MQAVARGVEMLCHEIAPHLLQDQADPSKSKGKAPVGLIAGLTESLKAGEQKTSQIYTLLSEIVENSKKSGELTSIYATKVARITKFVRHGNGQGVDQSAEAGPRGHTQRHCF